MKITRQIFGQLDGQAVHLFTLCNGRGMQVRITDYGATITSITLPDQHGRPGDIVCGYDRLAGYMSPAYRANSPYFGCTVGRYASLLKDGQFQLAGHSYQLTRNAGAHHLHGGAKGFDKHIWTEAGTVQEPEAVKLKLSFLSRDGDEGYPGNLHVQVEFCLTATHELRIRYQATTDQATPLSLTNHTYFNLNGFRDKVLDHVVQLEANHYLLPDETGIPAGAAAAVAGTVFDFTRPRRLGDCFGERPTGFEHFYLFNRPAGTLAKVAEITEPTSGRKLEMLTTEPGTLLYTGRYTADNLQREDGTRYGQFRGFCLEASKHPNGPNLSHAPGCILEPGAPREDTTIYKFGW